MSKTEPQELAELSRDVWLDYLYRDEMIKALRAGIKDPDDLLNLVNARIYADLRENSSRVFGKFLENAQEIAKTAATTEARKKPKYTPVIESDEVAKFRDRGDGDA